MLLLTVEVIALKSVH